MSIDSASNEFLDQFRNISNKLKKRFLRKPNVTEASDAFASLGLQCEQCELKPYAGLCWVAAARCENSLGNCSSEMNCLLRAAKQFIDTELNDQAIGCPSQSNQYLQAALNCYSFAGTRCSENSPLNIGFNMEIGDILKNKFHLNENAKQYLRIAVAQSNNCFELKLNCLGSLASIFIETGDYTSALAVFSEMSHLLEGIHLTGIYIDIQVRCEFSRVFLLLILRPTAQRLATPLARLLEKYMWGDSNDLNVRVIGMSAHQFLLMQSLVMACQSQDTTILPNVEAEFWPHLSKELRDLLRILVRQYSFQSNVMS